MRLSRAVYRALIHLYPARFREQYGALLEAAFLEERTETRGAAGVVRLWVRTVADFAASFPVELAGEVRQDVLHCLRLHAKRPFLTISTVATLTLGIGATTGVFAVVNATLIRPLPFAHAERLVALEGFRSEPIASNEGRFRTWREQSATFFDDSLVYATRDEVNVSAGGRPVRAMVVNSTANFFELLGVEPLRGTVFRAGGAPAPEAAVIGYDLWQRACGGDPEVVGRTVRVNDRPFVVIGVARRGFDYPDGAQVWTNSFFSWPWPDGSFRMVSVGRLHAGVTLDRARRDFRDYVRQGRVRSNWNARLAPLQEHIAGRFGRASVVLLGSVAFVLLIACANVAHLLLTRVSERREELAIRVALGAGRARLFQQLLTECVLLSSVAGVASLLVARWTTRMLQGIAPPALPSQEYAIADWRVLALTALLVVGSGLLFAVLPGLGQVRLQSGGGRPRIPGRLARRPGLRHALIAGQVALSLVLLTGALVMVSTLRALLATDYGLQTANILTASVSVEGLPAYDRTTARNYYARAVERLRTVPGVAAVSGVNFLPMAQYTHYATNFTLNWRIAPADEYRDALSAQVSSGYFRTMGIPMLAGRDFTEADGPASPPVVIVSEEFAGGYPRPADVLGRTLEHGRLSGTIVGVVRSVKYKGPGVAVAPQTYWPIAQGHWPYFTFVLETREPPRRVAAAARAALASVDPQVPVYGVSTLDDRLAALVAEPRFYTFAITLLGGLALLLVVIGVYAIVSHSVARRTHEIGVRLVVGATAGDVRRQFLSAGLVPVAVGAVAGTAGALAVGRLTAALVHTAAPVDLRQPLAAALGLLVVAALAIWRATTAVTRVDATQVLRADF